MSSKGSKQPLGLGKRRIKKVKPHQSDPTAEEINLYGSDLNIKIVKPVVITENVTSVPIKVDNFTE